MIGLLNGQELQSQSAQFRPFFDCESKLISDESFIYFNGIYYPLPSYISDARRQCLGKSSCQVTDWNIFLSINTNAIDSVRWSAYLKCNEK
jgi:hypothetical protein